MTHSDKSKKLIAIGRMAVKTGHCFLVQVVLVGRKFLILDLSSQKEKYFLHLCEWLREVLGNS